MVGRNIGRAPPFLRRDPPSAIPNVKPRRNATYHSRETVQTTGASSVCPAAGCGRRVAILYSGGIFACRRCHRLAYASSREDVFGRSTGRAETLRARLGWDRGILNGEGGKPKWMRWRTFERLTAEHDAFVRESLAAMAQLFGIKS